MKLRFAYSLICSVLTFCLPALLTAQIVVDFEDIDLSTPNTFIAETFESGGVTFNRPGTFEGYVVSNATVNQDLTIAPFALPDPLETALNLYSAFVPEDGATSNYAVLEFGNSDAPRTAPRGTIFAPSGTQFQSINVANTTFAARNILVGNAFATAFDDASEFRLFISGSRDGVVTGEVDFVLADGQNVVDAFTEVSLESLNGADEISFSLSSTDTGDFGINTATFIAIDDLTFVTAAVPEPSSLVILGLGGLTVLLRRRKS